VKHSFQGSCHRGAVRPWKAEAIATSAEVRLHQAAEATAEYRFDSRAVRHQFYLTCGVELFSRLKSADRHGDAFDGAPVESRFL
jgi:hypothetical protein